MSLRRPGCSPVSRSSLAEPNTVCAASISAVSRLRPTFTPPSGEVNATTTETVSFRVIPAKAKGGDPTVHAIRKGERGALVISALEFDKAMAIFKELTGSK